MSTPAPTFNEQMVTKLKALLLLSAGMDSVTVDGQVVRVRDLKKELEYWEAEVADEDGTNPGWMNIDLSNGM
jgi:hypothetical protein